MRYSKIGSNVIDKNYLILTIFRHRYKVYLLSLYSTPKWNSPFQNGQSPSFAHFGKAKIKVLEKFKSFKQLFEARISSLLKIRASDFWLNST